MAKVNVEQKLTIILRMSEEESDILKSYLQNPPDRSDKKIVVVLKELFEALPWSNEILK